MAIKSSRKTCNDGSTSVKVSSSVVKRLTKFKRVCVIFFI